MAHFAVRSGNTKFTKWQAIKSSKCISTTRSGVSAAIVIFSIGLPKPLCNRSHILKINKGLVNWLHIKNDYKWRCTKWLLYKRMNQFCNHLCFEDQTFIILGKKIVIWDWHKKRLISFLIFFQDYSVLIFRGHLWINFSVASEIGVRIYLRQN